MRANQYIRNKVFELRSETGRALTTCGIWMLAAYAGASTLLIGLLRLIHEESAPSSALTLMLAGGALAAFAWRRAYRVLDRIETARAATCGQARMPASRNTSGLTTLVGAPEA